MRFGRGVNIYYCGREECKPMHSFGPAVRNHYLMHVVLEGRGEFHAGGKVYPLKQGEAFLIRPDESTYYIADKEEPWIYSWVAFDGYEVERILEDCGFDVDNPIYTPYHGGKYFEENSEVDQIHTIEEISGHMRELVMLFHSLEKSSYGMLGHLYMIFDIMERKIKPWDLSYEKEYLYKACEYISHNYSYQIKVQDIAKYIGIDRTYLYKIFKKEMNLSPQNYLKEFRIKAAKNMLKHTQLSVSEIGYSCGFHDSPSFCKSFKKTTGCTPMEYRLTKDT